MALGPLIDYIAEKDPALVNAVGRLDIKLFDKLVKDLETIRLPGASSSPPRASRSTPRRCWGWAGTPGPARPG